MDFSKKLDETNALCVDNNELNATNLFENDEEQQKQIQHDANSLDDVDEKHLALNTSNNESGDDMDLILSTKSAIENMDRKTESTESVLLNTAEEVLTSDVDNMGMRDTPTPLLASNFTTNLGQMSPPARPLTCSEVVGLTSLLDADDELSPSHKSRSLPVSPANTAAAAASSAALLLPHMNALFDYNVGGLNDMRSSARLIEARRKRLREAKALGAGASRSPIALGSQQQPQFCLRWNNYQTNLTNVFDELLQSESFVDVTLACEGQSIKAHKMVLSACSPYFQALFFDNPCQHPIIIMRDVRWQELKAIMEFMYKGEINVSQEQIDPLLKVAEMLKIRGLAEVSARHGDRDVSLAAAPQHMSVFDDDLDDQDVTEHVLRMVNPRLNSDDSDELETKRRRLGDNNSNEALQLNLNAMQQRKRARDGLLLPGEQTTPQLQQSRTSTPSSSQKESTRQSSDCGINNEATPPVSATASTIVRNPFASPNATPSAPPPANCISSSSVASNMPTSADPVGGNTSSSYRQSPPLPPPHSPSVSRASEGVASGNASSSSNSSTAATVNASGCDFSSAAAGMSHQLPTHSHSVAAAFSSPHLLPHQGHHHHHHHHAASHGLHASHSHAAIASALAAVAAGAGGSSATGPGSSTGTGSMVGPSSHHDDLEIKPEIAEMIREEERVSV